MKRTIRLILIAIAAACIVALTSCGSPRPDLVRAKMEQKFYYAELARMNREAGRRWRGMTPCARTHFMRRLCAANTHLDSIGMRIHILEQLH